MYFRGSINWNKWATGVSAAKYIVFDDIDWSAKNKYTRDMQKAIFSGQASFDKCSADAYMRTITHGKPVIVCMNNETLEEGNVLKEWQADPWKQKNVVFCEIPAPLYDSICHVDIGAIPGGSEAPLKRPRL